MTLAVMGLVILKVLVVLPSFSSSFLFLTCTVPGFRLSFSWGHDGIFYAWAFFLVHQGPIL